MPPLMVKRLVSRGHTALAPQVDLDDATASELGKVLSKELHDTGNVLVSLDGVRVVSERRGVVFATALEQAGGWPLARLVLYGGSASVVRTLEKLGVTRTVPHADTARDAAELLSRRPPLVRRRAVLGLAPDAPRLARTMLDEVAALWQVPQEMVETTRLVLSELVTNAVRYASGECRVQLEFTGTRTRVSVDDKSAETPRVVPENLDAEGGRGLLIVAAVAENWGVTYQGSRKHTWAVIGS